MRGSMWTEPSVLFKRHFCTMLSGQAFFLLVKQTSPEVRPCKTPSAVRQRHQQHEQPDAADLHSLIHVTEYRFFRQESIRVVWP
jgi:hypothetical protein